MKYTSSILLSLSALVIALVSLKVKALRDESAHSGVGGRMRFEGQQIANYAKYNDALNFDADPPEASQGQAKKDYFRWLRRGKIEEESTGPSRMQRFKDNVVECYDEFCQKAKDQQKLLRLRFGRKQTAHDETGLAEDQVEPQPRGFKKHYNHMKNHFRQPPKEWFRKKQAEPTLQMNSLTGDELQEMQALNEKKSRMSPLALMDYESQELEASQPVRRNQLEQFDFDSSELEAAHPVRRNQLEQLDFDSNNMSDSRKPAGKFGYPHFSQKIGDCYGKACERIKYLREDFGRRHASPAA